MQGHEVTIDLQRDPLLAQPGPVFTQVRVQRRLIVGLFL
jgi:hypothetical protein